MWIGKFVWISQHWSVIVILCCVIRTVNIFVRWIISKNVCAHAASLCMLVLAFWIKHLRLCGGALPTPRARLRLAETYLIYAGSKQASLISLPLCQHILSNLHFEAFLHHQGLKTPTSRSIQLAKQRSGLINATAQEIKRMGQGEQERKGRSKGTKRIKIYIKDF